MDIRMNKEIRDYKETTFGIFTLRQGLCIGAMCTLACLLNFKMRGMIDQNLMIFLYILVAAPFLIIGDFFGGFFKKNYGTNTVGFVKIVFRYLFEPKQLKFVGRNVIQEMAMDLKKEEERREKLEKIRKATDFRKRKAHCSKNSTASHSDSEHLERRHFSKRKDIQ